MPDITSPSPTPADSPSPGSPGPGSSNPGAAPRGPSTTRGRRPGNPRAWHRKASRPVSVWLVALVVVALAFPWIPQSRWLLVHLVTLGVATTSVLVWGQYFTEAILHNRLGEMDRRRQVARIRILSLGILTCCVGIVATWPWVVVAGAVLVGGALTWYAFALGHQVRHAMPGRFDATVRFYCAAACLLPLGASLGAILAFSPAEPWRTRLLLAHQALNLLGFIGLTVIGTLVTLWPTVLRTPMQPRQDRHGRMALVIVVVAVALTTAAALPGWWWLGAVGVTTWIIGLAVVIGDLVACAVRKPPRDYPGYAMGAAVCWLVVWVVWLDWTLVSQGRELVADDLMALSWPVIIGFLLQLVLGSMSYLMPMVMGGGPSVVRATNAKMHAFGALRAVLTNAGLMVWLLALGTWTRRAGMVLTGLGLAGFLPATAAMVRTGVPLLRAKAAERAATTARDTAAPSPGQAPTAGRAPSPGRATSSAASPGQASPGQAAPGPAAGPSPEVRAGRPAAVTADPAPTAPASRRSFVEAVTGLGVTLAAVGVGHRLDSDEATAGTPGTTVRPTGKTTRVRVSMKDMRYHPDTLTVAPGNRLVIDLHNDDPSQVHDLLMASGARSPRLAPGGRASLDAGVITEPTTGWCTIVGHRAMGMELHVQPTGTSPAAPSTSSASTTRVQADLTQPPGAGFRPRDAALPALLPGRVHPLTLTVTESDQEVAPATTMRAMTYDGRVMGPVLHARVGDTMKVHLVNRGSMGHSIDFHAGMVSPDATMRTIAPGRDLHYDFTLPHAGIWLYHCSTMPMSTHIAAGMFGAVVVPPPDLPEVDRQYVLVQSQAYLDPATTDGAHEVSPAKIAAETPDLSLFNGHANQYVHHPLRAKVGERVRIWVLAAGPSRGLSFHVVGTQFDTVFKEGAYLLRRDNPESGGAQALDLASCQGGFVEMTFPEPGRYTFVNHSFVEMERGARGFIEVTA